MATWTGSLSCSQSDTNAEKNGKVRFYYTAGNGKITIHQIQGNRTDGYLTNYYSVNNKITISVGSQSKDVSIYDIGFGASAWREWTNSDGSNLTDVSFSASGTQTVKITIKSWNGTSSVSNGAYWSTSINCGSSTSFVLTLKTSTGVESFTGGGTYADGEKVSSIATAQTGYLLSKYEGTTYDGSGTDTWTECAGLSSHEGTWTMRANRTVTAYASPINYIIRYNSNGGTGSMADTVATYGANTSIAKNTFTKEGYVFIGWYVKREHDQKWRYTSANGTSKGWYVEGQQPTGYVKFIYKDEVILTNPTSVNEDVINLYAQWKESSEDEDSGWASGLVFVNSRGSWVQGLVWKKVDGVWISGIGYARGLEEAPILTAISISSPYTGGPITVEEEYDLPGLEITAHYSDGSSKVVTNWTKSPEIFNNVGQLQVTISYTEGDITKTTSFGVNVWT